MISKEEVIKIAKLARLELTDKEIEKMQKDMSAVLDYFDILKKVKGQPNVEVKKKENRVREDKAMERSSRVVNDLLAQVPERKDEYIKVKAVL